MWRGVRSIPPAPASHAGRCSLLNRRAPQTRGSRRCFRGLPFGWRLAVAVLFFVALSGCQGVQSTLAPAGHAADAIAELWWVMFWGGCAVFALVIGLALFTISPYSGRLRRQGLVVAAGGLLLPVVTLVALLIYGTMIGREAIALGARSDVVVEVTGKQWQWEFAYLDDRGRTTAVSTNLLALPVDKLVEFRITSEDVIHSFWVPRLGGKMDAIPGRINTLRLSAQQLGVMRGQCAEFCGLAHATMAFDVVVHPQEDFEAWLGEQREQRAVRGAVAP